MIFKMRGLLIHFLGCSQIVEQLHSASRFGCQLKELRFATEQQRCLCNDTREMSVYISFVQLVVSAFSQELWTSKYMGRICRHYLSDVLLIRAVDLVTISKLRVGCRDY